MTCQELLDQLLDYCGGELVVEQCQLVEVHIASCKNCTVRIETYRCTTRIVRALPKCKMSAACEERLRKALEPELQARAGNAGT